MSWKFSTFSCLLLSALSMGLPAALAKDPPKAAADEPALLPVAELKHPKPVDFQREVLPILKKNCLACHNTTDAEAKLILETPQTILKGGENGPAVVPKKGAESLLLVRARGGGDGIMPPEDNKVAALPLKPEELGLIKLWIDQGATGSVQQTAETIHWQPLPPGVNPVYSLALTEDGQYVACGRANQIFIYQVPTGRLVCRLSDPALLKAGIYKQLGVADLDLIQSLAFSPDGQVLASGGYRDVKLWRRPRNVREFSWADRLGVTAQTLAVSPDGKLLATAGADHTIKIWNLADGKELKSLAGHSNTVTGLVFAPDAKLLVSGALDKTVRVWRLPEGTLAGTIDTPSTVQAVALVAGGNLLASGEADGRVRVWDNPLMAKPVDAKKPEVPKAEEKKTDAGKGAKDTKAKAGDTKVAVAPAVKPVRELTGHTKAVTSLVTLNKAPTQIVSSSEDGTAILWDAGSGKQIRQYKHGGPIAAVAVRPDDQRVATAGRDKVAKLWGLGDAKLMAEMRGDLRARSHMANLERQVNSAKSIATAEKAAVTESEKAATAEADNVKKSIDAKTAAEKAKVEKTAAEKKPLDEKAAADKALVEATSAASKAVEDKKAADEALAKADTALKVADTAVQQAKAALKKDAKNKQLAEASTAVEKKLAEAKTKAADAKKAQTVAQKATTDADARLKKATAEVPVKQKALDEAKKARETAELAVNTSFKALTAAEAAAKKAKERVPAAQKILAAAEAAVKQAEAQLADGKKAATDTEQPLRSVAFSSDNQQLATGNEAGLIHTWSADNGLPLEAYEGHHGAVGTVAFIGDRRLISGAADKTVMGWDTQPDWVWVRTLGASGAGFVDRVTALDFSPDGKLLATGGGAPSRSGELKIWDASDGRLVRDLPDAHSDTVFGVAFSPDGKQLASCGADKFVKVFDVSTGKFVRAFEGHTHHVLGVSWESDAKVLVSCGADNAVKVWDLDTGEQRRTITAFGKEVTSIHFVGDTVNVLGTSGDRSVRLMRTTDGGIAKSFNGAADYLYCGGATPDGKIIVASGQDSVLRVWNGETGQTLRNFDPPPSSGK